MVGRVHRSHAKKGDGIVTKWIEFYQIDKNQIVKS